MARYSDKQFAAYGLDPAAAAAIREQFADWHQEAHRTVGRDRCCEEAHL
ncbi:hypothetical protein [Kitasatospora kifunensis]|uniref:Uncharacterized protein n=1 Tax=Kitasatospora kifunensis TaxID=58351 RepID=A0A7W7R663_KITKI|nr:hypothetical protein [Kitasatospora kifunensis]MBB4926137.1 hypothetical protein [Kitasatospora kifunensis]